MASKGMLGAEDRIIWLTLFASSRVQSRQDNKCAQHYAEKSLELALNKSVIFTNLAPPCLRSRIVQLMCCTNKIYIVSKYLLKSDCHRDCGHSCGVGKDGKKNE